MTFCTNCGAQRSTGGAFCTACGAPQAPVTSATQPPPAPPAAPFVSNPVVPFPASVPAPQSGNGLRNFLIIAGVCLLLFIGLGIAGAIYAVRAAKHKAEAVLHQIAPSVAPAPARSSDAGEPATPVENEPLPPAAASSFPAWQPSGASAANGGPAPLKEGMLVVTAIADDSGDYESMKQITAIDSSGVKLSYHSDKPKAGTGSGEKTETTINRTVLTQDLATAHDYAQVFGTTDPQSFPGTTAITASREVFAELQQKGSSEFSFRPEGLKGALGGLLGLVNQMGGVDKKDLDTKSLEGFTKEKCNLQKEGSGLFAFPVLLNAQPTTLPAVRAACNTDDGLAEFYILNQPDYPLMLSWKMGSGSQLQVIKITYPETPKTTSKAAPNQIEEQLKEKKKVDIYGIYFDFASDRLKPESTPVLQEIAGVLKDNPDWKLTVNGHTDNIGGDPYNLELSQHRAAAVKLALVSQYHISPDRLTTGGFGATRPVDTNDTLAGRARNRRVELTRE